MTASTEFTATHAFSSDTRTPIRWIISHARRHKLIIFIILFGAFTNAILAAAIPIYTSQAFDALLDGTRLKANPNLNAVFWASVWLIISQIVRSVLQWGRNFGSEILGQRLERDTREELYGALLGKSMTFHDSHSSGELMARATNDVRELNLMFSPGLNLVIGSSYFLIVPLFIAPTFHPTLILTPFLFTIAYAIALRFYLRQLEPVTAEVRRSFGAMNSILTQAIEGIETVKGIAQEEGEINRFRKFARQVRDAFVHQGEIEARFLPLLLLGFANAIGFLHGMTLFQQGAITVGKMIAYIELINLFGFPVFISLMAYSQVSSGVSSARRVLELINSQTELDQNLGGVDIPIQGEIRFENVSFRYPTTHPTDKEREVNTLSNITFEISPGKTLAVVGQTGAGKSTISKLINRIYDVNEGRVLIDGVPVGEWNMAALRRQISIIEQDIFLFSRSIGENITFGRPDATPEEMVAAARAAQAHDFILQLDKGYETIVGERGVMLSGGQRQRIALARAFLTRPAILILDDSTSAIDSATEDQIQQAIESAKMRQTTILITHRLSQIRRADKILVLKQGRVAAIGTHEELLQTSEAYRNIFPQSLNHLNV